MLDTGSALLEAGVQTSFDDGEVLDIGQLLLRYGLGGAEVQVFLNSYAFSRPDAGANARGLRDMSVGAKIPVRADGAGRVSVLPVLILPVGSGAFGGGDWVPALSVLADRGLTARTSISLNAGASIASGETPASWSLVLTPSRSVGDRTSAYAGYAGFFSSGAPSHFVEAGVAFLTSPRRQIDLNGGVDVRTGTAFLGFGAAFGLR